MRPPIVKAKALQLRRNGYSYRYISEKLKISKSTLNGWFQGVPYSPNEYTVKVIGRARAASSRAKSALRAKDEEGARDRARKMIQNIGARDLLFLGLGVYIGEGSKSVEQARVVNADPRVIKLAIRWYCEIFRVKKEYLYLRLHLYPDSHIQKAIRYWSRETGIPVSRFQKPTIDRRTNKKIVKYGRLPNGTAHLNIVSGGDKEMGRHFARVIFSMMDIALED